MPDLLQAIGHDVWEESPEQLHAVEVGGAEAGAAHLPGGESDRAVRERDKATVGDGDLADRRGEGGEGGVAVMMGLAVDVPRDGPDLGIDRLQQSGVAHVFCEESPVDGGEGFDGDQEVGAGGTPGRAVRGEATARDNGVHVGVVRELPAPGRQDACAPREGGPDEALVGGQAFEGRCRGVQQSLVREALGRTEEGSEGLRHGEGKEEVRPGQLCVQVVLEPLLGCMLLTLGAVAVATGMLDAMVLPTVLALREAMAVRAALARLDGADDLAVRSGEVGRALQGLWGKRREDLAEGGHDRVSLLEVTRCLVEKEDSIDASWKGERSFLPRQRLT